MPVRRTVALAGGRKLVLSVNEIEHEPVEAIVNAANGGLSHGGGVALAISQAAGPAFDAECREYVRVHGYVPTGEAVVTSAGKLGYKGVIHAVGPRCGDGDEEGKLTRAIANALSRAHERGWKSVAFPGISSGIFAVPEPTCARAYLAGVRRHLGDHPDSSLREVRICLFLGKLLDLVDAELEALARGARPDF